LCQTLHGEIEALLLSATPPASANSIMVPHLTFVTNLDDVPTSGGARQVTWPGWATLANTSFQLPKTVSCYPKFGADDQGHTIYMAPDGVSLPVNITLSPRQRLLGLPQQTYNATTGTVLNNGAYTFDLQVPSGEYDIYLSPAARQLDCPVPPQLIKGKQISASEIPAFVATPSTTLDLLLHWPKGGASLDGWTADIIEGNAANVISTQVVLGSPVEQPDTFDYSIELVYSKVVDDDPGEVKIASLDDLFRLRPPGDVVAPTIYLDRPALELFSTGDGKPIEYTHFTRYPAPVQVEAQLVSLSGGLPMSGQVWLSSSAITGVDDGVFA
jgi:hypothetical protein